MRNRNRGRKIDERAETLLRDCGQFKAPVDVSTVAAACSARVVYEELDDDVSGFLLREQGSISIAINKQHPANRQRFTLAHEIGHLVLHADQGDRLWLDTAYYYRDGSSSKGDQAAEVQANQFAAGLLMPEELVKAEVQNSPHITEVDVMKLAMKFEVSERAMTFRLISLGLLEPVAA
jgi:Zn-dependent peptidase ImmA (M78 family)